MPRYRTRTAPCPLGGLPKGNYSLSVTVVVGHEHQVNALLQARWVFPSRAIIDRVRRLHQEVTPEDLIERGLNLLAASCSVREMVIASSKQEQGVIRSTTSNLNIACSCQLLSVPSKWSIPQPCSYKGPSVCFYIKATSVWTVQQRSARISTSTWRCFPIQ